VNRLLVQRVTRTNPDCPSLGRGVQESDSGPALRDSEGPQGAHLAHRGPAPSHRGAGLAACTCMAASLALIGISATVFVSTNIDDIFLLAAFFADPHLRARAIVAGQFLGIGVLVLGSALASVATLAIPEGYTALLGVVPLILGVRKLSALRGASGESASEEGQAKASEQRMERRTHSQVLAVAGVTIANGGDNLGVYIPLFASEPRAIPWHVVVFAVMTALWCLAGHALVKNRLLGDPIRRYGHLVLPFVLIGLGLYILAGARVLLM
jgi:cadmium resistance protein CadD (predicted permease)